MDEERKNWAINTRLNHPEMIELVDGNRPLIQPVYHSSKFLLSDAHPFGEQFIYGRVSNPTTRQLEHSLAEIQKKDDCIVVSSGIAALTGTFLGLLRAGDHIISFKEMYKPGRVFIRDFLPGYGVTSTFICYSDFQSIEKIITPRTKIIHFESPTNPGLEVADIKQIIHVARKHGVIVCMDGTFGGLHQHTDFDIDIMMQSLTKFANGHGDVIAGSIAGKSELIKKIREATLFLGAHLDPQAANLILRGLKTYLIRYQHQSRTALEVAEYLSLHPRVKKIRYPGLLKDPQHELAKEQMKDMGAVIAFEIAPEVTESADKFCHQLKLIQLAASLGSTESIICPTQTFFGLDLDVNERNKMNINDYSLRLSVGLEDAKDIISDLESVLGTL
jgi:cystathionine beta-lyase/cystathionine gamma-synthase